LALLLACSAVAVATGIGWALSTLAARVLLGRMDLEASNRAAFIAAARLLPLGAVVLLVPAQVQAFRTYEQGGLESAGLLLLFTATVGFSLLVNAVRRAAAAWRDTRRVMRNWRATATPLLVAQWPGRAWTMRSAFPVVAAAGVLRPQLFVARQVLDRCTADEMAAIAAHEVAHSAARDNLIRLLFELTPGARLFRRVADPLERAWVAASEEAADFSASQIASGLDLASALTKVVRLVSANESGPACASALIGGADLHDRIRRLLNPPPARRVSLRCLPLLVLVGAAAVLQMPPVSEGIHEAFELLVRHH
jgi:Zn-dependent protease with chaperone function